MLRDLDGSLCSGSAGGWPEGRNGARSATIGTLVVVAFLLLVAALDAGAQEQTAAGTEEAAPARASGLRVQLHLEQRNLSWGRTPEIRARLENGGEESVLVLLPCDGSVEDLRVPAYRWEVTFEDGSPAPTLPRIRCGNVNAFAESDFVRLEPGAHVDLDDGWLSAPGRRFSFLRPGRYTIRLRYVVRKDEGPYRHALPLGVSGDRSAVEALWAEVPEIEVVSDEVTIRVGAPHGRAGERLEAFARIHDGLGMAEVRDLLGEPDTVVPDESPGVEHWAYWLQGEPPEGEPTISSIYMVQDRPRIVIRFDDLARVLGCAVLP